MDKATALKDQGNKEYTAGNFIRAIELYNAALAEREDAVFYSNRAACYIGLKKYREAAADSYKALELNPLHANSYFRGSQALSIIGKINEAFELIRKGIEKVPTDAVIRREYDTLQILLSYQNSIEGHVEAGEYSDALRKLNSLLEKSTRCSEFIEKKIIVLCLSGDLTTAASFVKEKEALMSQIADLKLIACKAMVARFSNKLDEAKSLYVRIANENPGDQEAIRLMREVKQMEDIKHKATDSFNAKKFEEAMGFYDQAVGLDPKNRIWKAVMLSNKASCLMGLKKMTEAKDLMREATDLDPNNAKMFFKRGKLEKDLGDYESAEINLKKAKTMDSTLQIDGVLKDVIVKLKQTKKDFYSILGVSKEATTEEIKKAYKELARKWHPDKHSGSKEEQEKAEKMFKDISEAHKVLSDPEQRKRYNLGGFEAANGSSFTDFSNMGHGMGDMHANTVFQMFFNSGSNNMFSFGQGGQGGRGGGSGGRNPHADLFKNFTMGFDDDDMFERARGRRR